MEFIHIDSIDLDLGRNLFCLNNEYKFYIPSDRIMDKVWEKENPRPRPKVDEIIFVINYEDTPITIIKIFDKCNINYIFGKKQFL